MSELPLRVVDQPGGAVIRCLCGQELARVRRALVTEQVSVRIRENHARPNLSPDITAAGLAVMVAHAIGCGRGKALLAEQQSRIYAR
jgi:hypothetical protein